MGLESELESGLSLATYSVYFIGRERLNLPIYLGSTLRGAFGRAFRQIACLARPGAPCPTPLKCPYHLIFESAPPPGAEALRTHEAIPRPFVLAPEWNTQEHDARLILEPGEELSFTLTLIGRAREYFPHFVMALREMQSIGRGHRTIELVRIESIDPRNGDRSLVYDAGDKVVRATAPTISPGDFAREVPVNRLTIEFLSQTRLKHENSWVRVPEFHILFRRLLGRLSSLSRFHCGVPLEVDFKAMIERAQKISLVSNRIRWVSWSRYSSRQDRKMRWDGIVGTATYQGDLTPFWPYLKFGEYTHVGHGATFGLGKYQVLQTD